VFFPESSEPRDFQCCFRFWRYSPQWARASSFTRFLDHTQQSSTVGDSSGRVISSSQRPLPDNTQHSQQTNTHAPSGIWTHNPSRRAAADLRLRTRSHWARLFQNYTFVNMVTRHSKFLILTHLITLNMYKMRHRDYCRKPEILKQNLTF